MKKLAISAILMLGGLFAAAQSDTERQQLLSEIEGEITSNVLPYWLEHAPDGHGGYCGVITADGHGIPQAPRGAVLGGRLLWTYSSAYRIYGLPVYRQMADMMQRYYIDHLIDPVHGGVYWAIDVDGVVSDGTKQAYALAFGIYGLSEHFRATGKEESLDRARDLYATLKDKMHDGADGGYREAMTRDFTSLANEGVDGRTDATKTMNTHIHILEALTNLYRVWPDEAVAADIRELIGILGHQLYDAKTGHLVIFCDDQWHPLEDVESYGHDIETSWLLTEAAEVLGDEALIADVRRQAVAMTDAALRDGGCAPMYYELTPAGINKKQSWWVQCEAVVGCLNAWQITGDKRYFDKACQSWQYIKDNFVDGKRGEWHHNIMRAGEVNNEPKGSMWNCPYHNSRMAFEARERLAHQGVHSQVMAWSNITGVRQQGQLVDFETSLAVGVPGAKIEHTGRERQNGVRYRRDGLTQTVDIPTHGAHFHQEVTDVDGKSIAVSIDVEADTTLAEGAYWCIVPYAERKALGGVAPKPKVTARGRHLAIKDADQTIDVTFDKSVKTRVVGDSIYVTLLPTLVKGQKASLSATMSVNGVKQDQPVNITLDPSNPGRRFMGFGGNFRIQNPKTDPMVIDYCLDNMSVAMGRVEFPWAAWDRGGATDPHVQASAQMARRLKAQGMPVVVSCWFPPQWALAPGSVRQRGGVAALRLDPAKTDTIYDALASYLVYLKNEHGVEADYFSFNESDIGIDVLFTPQEHCEFIKGFGAKLAELGLPCKMLLGDNSDATTTWFIEPSLADAEARPYIGAVSFHSWRGCDDATLQWWRDAAASINVPLIVGEGSTDAAAWRYSQIFLEPTFALYEINLYTRLCAICQPLSILQWQLTADYSLLRGQGVLRDDGPLRPTQRYYNLWQLAQTPDGLAIPATADEPNANVAAMYNAATGRCAVHIVNNGASRQARISGLPEGIDQVTVYVTNAGQNAEAQRLAVSDGQLTVEMPPESFVTILK